jgi:purine-binding chemotaxis protein CheW
VTAPLTSSVQMAAGSWATFRLAHELFAVATETVHEVLTSQPLTSVPLAPPHVVGLLHLRGLVMPAIDLRRRLRHPPAPDGRPGNVLVLKTADGFVGAIVDAVGDVLEIDADRWSPPPQTLPPRERECVFGVCPLEDGVLLGLRVDVLDSEDSQETEVR